jgi:hypothetical protein
VETSENYSLTAGTGLAIDVTLRDSNGNVVTTYAGTETLTTTVWPGGTRPASFTAATAWLVPASGTLTVTIGDADTASLPPGRYQLLTQLTSNGTTVNVYGCTLDIVATAGTEATPKMYVAFPDLLRYGRAWLSQLQTNDDEAGYAEQIGRATSWMDDLAHAHFRVASMTMVVGGQAFGPRQSGARSTWLQEQLDAEPPTIQFTDQFKECCAKKALAYICEGQLASAEAAAWYGKLARMYHSQADYIACNLTIALDTTGNGYPDIVIDCSSASTLIG